ncbi:R3h domain [Mycena kentingensis (nom. inval.)]|nr:R3h domain [Mycena kentingensis (nom. inval.)]
MTGSPPDLSALTLSGGRLHDSYEFDGNSAAARPQYHFATSTGIPAQTPYPPLGPGQSPLKKPARSGLPAQWMDAPDNRSLSPQNNSDFSSAGGSPPPMSHLSSPPPPPMAASPSQGADDEVIPTAIVIKNIPFNVKRETLLDIIASLAIPTPYAFNYHLDQQGSFRGLAFANFRQAADADAVVVALNGFDVQGRKLRVEYKKVLQAGEKERIEREKAIRRMRSMQLDKDQIGVGTPVYEDYGSPIPSGYTPQRSYSGTPYQAQQQYSPTNVSPMPQYNHVLASAPAASQNTVVSSPPSTSDKGSANELDLNDPATLEIYSRILLFKDDRMRDELAFSRTLSPKQRRVVHLVAQKLGVYHYSVGEGEERYAVVTRIDPARQQQRPPHTLSRAPSAYLAQQASQTVAQSLRVKKSMPDMKTLPSQAPRLNPRSSNGNIREGYATISTPRRQSTGYNSLFSNGGAFGGVPPVPAVPMTGSLSSGHESPGGVVRQPRGPGVGGFVRRDSRVGLSESANRGGLEAPRSDSLEGADGRGH